MTKICLTHGILQTYQHHFTKPGNTEDYYEFEIYCF